MEFSPRLSAPFMLLVGVAAVLLIVVSAVAGITTLVNNTLRGDAGITVEDLFVPVDYSQSISMAVEAGNYSGNFKIRTEKIPLIDSGAAVVRIFLLHFGQQVQTEDVLAEMTRRNLRPANLQELLAIGKEFPQKQRWYPIVALGTTWADFSGFSVCGYLYCHLGVRFLEQHIMNALPWESDLRFAAVSI